MDETMTLRIALAAPEGYPLFRYFWHTHWYLYTDKHLYDVARFICKEGKFDIFGEFMASNTTKSIFTNSDANSRTKFVTMLQSFQNTDIQMLLESFPFNFLDTHHL